jgi:tetratricopeptide (TPR) repeat protein
MNNEMSAMKFKLIVILCIIAGFANAQSKAEENLAIAKKNFDENPSEENYIWYGRRTGYLLKFDDAVRIYTEGLKKYPDSYRILRHRGHRYISMRKFDLAIADLTKAEKLMAGKPLEVEPDGVPNKLNKPLSTTQFNVYYHLALAYYLKADFKKAEETWKKCLAVCENDDSKVAAIDWLYMTLRRQGKNEEGKKLLDQISDPMEIIENDSYYQRLKMYKNGTALPEPETPLDIATLGYGLGNWYLYNGDTTKAVEMFKKVVSGTESAAFGYIAAETDLARLQAKK